MALLKNTKVRSYWMIKSEEIVAESDFYNWGFNNFPESSNSFKP